jgi:Fe-S cluster assembly protein SufD
MEELTTVSIEDQIIDSFQATSDFQKTSLAQFKDLGIPLKKSEAYKFTPIKNILSKNFDWSAKSEFALNIDVTAHFYPIVKANHLVFLNGTFDMGKSIVTSDTSELVISAITEKDNLYNSLGIIADQKNDAFAAWNGAKTSIPLHIEVIKNTQNIPTFIYHFADSTSSESYSYPRIIVKSNSGSELSIYEKLIVSGDNNTFINSVIEAEVKDNASLKYTKTQDYPANVFAVEAIYGTQSSNSRFYTNTYSFSGSLIRNNISIAIDGENCEGHMNGIYLLDHKSHVDNNTAVDHRAPNSYSNELYKGVLKGHSKGVFNGKIYVRPIAQKTNAFQSNNNVLLSEFATINTKPQLEIWADDVKCSHGCTVGQLDEDAIFYLRARGISKEDAITLMLNAFTKDTLKEVNEEYVKNQVLDLIEKGLKNE